MSNEMFAVITNNTDETNVMFFNDITQAKEKYNSIEGETKALIKVESSGSFFIGYEINCENPCEIIEYENLCEE